jgi:hypothetical protein
MSTYAYASSYSYAHNVAFLSDNLRNSLREVIRESGLNPDKLMQDWKTVERGLQAWLHSRHLYHIVVEFYRSGASMASARWDIPIGYDGLGVDDDMWPDTAYLRQLIAKAARPTADCTYRTILCTHTGAPPVDGFEDCSFLATGSMIARSAGTIIAAGQLTASVTYWRHP